MSPWIHARSYVDVYYYLNKVCSLFMFLRLYTVRVLGLGHLCMTSQTQLFFGISSAVHQWMVM